MLAFCAELNCRTCPRQRRVTHIAARLQREVAKLNMPSHDKKRREEQDTSIQSRSTAFIAQVHSRSTTLGPASYKEGPPPWSPSPKAVSRTTPGCCRGMSAKSAPRQPKSTHTASPCATVKPTNQPTEDMPAGAHQRPFSHHSEWLH